MERREFLIVAGAAVVASAMPDVSEAAQRTAALKILNAHEGETLLKMSRQLYPHSRLNDAHYMKVVQDLDAEASAAPATAKLLRDGIAKLDGMTNVGFVALASDQQLAALKKVESSEFFQKVRSTEVVSLYNNQDVWEVFGYPGASYRTGGYLHHGFNDLTWLPDPPEQASPKPA